MRLHIVNPNTTGSMTAKIAEAARRVAAPGTEVVAGQPHDGPASIEGHFDGALSIPGMLGEIVRAEAAGADGHVIACFDDTGLDAARSIATAPVIGIGEAACHMASLVADRFSVVTTLSRSVPVLERNLVHYGLIARCGRVRASEVPVLALEEPGSSAREKIAGEIERAIAEDRAEGIVLGCAGMADFAADLSDRFGMPVVEGVGAAVKLVEVLVGLGLRTSKVGAWAPPLAKAWSGPHADLARSAGV